MGSLKKTIKKNIFVLRSYYFVNKIFSEIFHLDRHIVERGHKEIFGYKPDLDNPKTLNEKIHWLKLNDREPFHTLCADKYEVRKYLAKKFGSDGLIPLAYQTYDWKDIKPGNIPDYPCIVKANHGSGMHFIIRNKTDVNWKELRKKCREWLSKNYYYNGSREWQYKDIRPCIIVEKLLLDENGKIPNDYKLNYFNGKLEFVYCSIDREGNNYRNIYDSKWKPLNFAWVAEEDHHPKLIGPGIDKPKSFKKMVEIGNEISKKFCLVRVDFYDIDGKLYYGEITLHHGGGYDTFKPSKYDLIYGDKLDLKRKPNRKK